MYERFIEGGEDGKNYLRGRVLAQYIIRWCDVKPIVKSEDME